MDGMLSDEVTEPVDVTHLQNKENDFLMKPGSSSILQSEEMVTPGLDDFTDCSKNVYLDTLDGKNLDRIGSSEHASASPHCTDDACTTMVEELTFKNYDGKNLTIASEKSHTRRAQWQHLYQIGGGSGIGNMAGQIGNKGKGQAISSAWEEKGNNFFSGLVDQNDSQPIQNRNAIMGSLLNNEDKGASGEILYSCGDIRTKIVNKSGFSEYFIKNNLKGKGVIHKIPGCRGSFAVEADNQDRPKYNFVGLRANDAPSGLNSESASHLSHVVSEPLVSLSSESTVDGISLREWLEEGRNNANKSESLRLFKQVLDIVNFSHSRGVSLQDLRPSMFKLSGTCQVTYVGTSVRAGLLENVTGQNIHQSSLVQSKKRQMNQSMRPLEGQSVKKRKLAELHSIRRTPQFPSRSGIISTSKNVDDVNPLDSVDDVDDENNLKMESKKHRKFMGHTEQPSQGSLSCISEEKWYTSPEQFNEMRCTFASNIYCLGVLLFELLGSFDSEMSHVATMEDLRYRILPPSFLSENSKEAGFCLWLLHPQPSLRPTTREILHSEFVSGIQEISESEILPSIDEEDEKSELLSHFLLLLNEKKQQVASNLQEQIQRIEADIQEVENRRPKQPLLLSSSPKDSSTANGDISTLGGNPSLDGVSKMSHGSREEKRLVNNKQLESAYFSMRSNIHLPAHDSASHRDRDLLKYRDKHAIVGKEADKKITTDRLGAFFDGLSKYARYIKFKERGVVRNGEFNNSANVMCLSFDRDEDYLASGGVSKKIKVFEFQSLFNDSVDIHYPVVEMANKSKLSCVCWNRYIRNYLASTDYDGIVKLWDAATGQGLSNFIEHSQRAWSVDFSVADPMKLASGSDDRLVKVWSMNEKKSLCTIKSNANVCSVQFSAESSHLLAFSSADYKTYCYDLRNVSTPWCILAGHEKAVSYVKFLDAGTVVSASTDNTLKIWDLSKTSSHCLSKDACILTLRGHANEKNFVGLSVADGYIACGSETNEVYAYYKSLPMPITSHKFGSIDPITGKETEDNNQQFVSSVCWRRKSNMVVAANSSGCIKLLQLV